MNRLRKSLADDFSKEGLFMENPIVNFSGELVALGPMSKDYMTIYMKCNNDFHITRTLGDFEYL